MCIKGCMACGAWTSIKNKVCNLKTNQSRRCEKVMCRNTAFSFLAVILKSVLTHINTNSQGPFTCLADFSLIKLISQNVCSQSTSFIGFCVMNVWAGPSVLRHWCCCERRHYIFKLDVNLSLPFL